MRRKHFLIAILFDLTIGEPPNRWHPVVWMGNLISTMRKATPENGKFLYGGVITFGGGILVWLLAKLAQQVIGFLPAPVKWVVEAWLLKTTFSLRGLNKAAHEVENALRMGDLVEARRLLSWHLVSRKTDDLNESQIAAAAIESVAENTSDGIIAPLFFYSVAGLPAALSYRYIQTCDSILGYRDVEREWLGKVPARTDDVLNLIPARLTASLFVLLHPRAWHIWRRDARLTDSPNAGHPMSAMAGALDIELEKVGHYKLNADSNPPQVDDIRRSRHLMLSAVGIFSLLLIILKAKR